MHARETPVSATFYLQALSHSCPRFREKRFGEFFFALFILSFRRSRVLWVLDFCRVHAPEAAVLAPVSSEFDFPACSKSLRSRENPCPNQNKVHVPSAYAHQRIHAQTMITFVPSAYAHQRTHAKTMITFVPSAYAHQRTHAKTIITIVFQVHTLTKEPMCKP